MTTAERDVATLSVGLTEEDERRLSAPFPRDVIKSFVGKGGKEMRYIDVEVLEARVHEVDRNWEKHIHPGPLGVAVHYTINGVTRGDMYDNDDESNKYGKPQVNALSRGSRRALRKFGVGADMWEDEETTETPAKENVREFKRPQEKAGSGVGSTQGMASPKQISYLKDAFGVPASVAAKLTSGREGQASQLIEALREAKKNDEDAYGDDPTPFIRRALKKINPKLVPLLDEDEDDEDED